MLTDWALLAISIFVVEKSSANNEGQLQVTKAVYFQDKYSNDKRNCDAALLIEPIQIAIELKIEI